MSKREKTLVAAALGLVLLYGGIVLIKRAARPSSATPVESLARQLAGLYVPTEEELVAVDEERVFRTENPSFLVDTLSRRIGNFLIIRRD